MGTELTIVSNALMADGIGRQGIGLAYCLNNSEINYEYRVIGNPNFKDIPKEVLPKIVEGINKPFNESKIIFWTYILGLTYPLPQLEQLKHHSESIKIAYSMFESDSLPKMWVNVINEYFHRVLVPDEWLVDVYKKSGVKKPIDVIPLGMFIEEFLKVPLKEKPNGCFTFGMSGGFWERKNHLKVLNAFNKKFGNNPKFKLTLHGRFGSYQSKVAEAVSKANLNNVELSMKAFSQQEYLQFMQNIDCYVFVSKGEGLSITPRECLALGKPCILSNNTAHKTICDSGYVIPIKAENKIPAIYEVFQNEQIGYFYDCDENELANKMEDVVNNYNLYLDKAKGGRDWVKQYLWSSLKSKYVEYFKGLK